MEIKKADSKGRVSGFEPGQLYQVIREEGIHLDPVVVYAPGGTDLEESIRKAMGYGPYAGSN